MGVYGNSLAKLFAFGSGYTAMRRAHPTTFSGFVPYDLCQASGESESQIRSTVVGTFAIRGEPPPAHPTRKGRR
jgi:hypothetical protein